MKLSTKTNSFINNHSPEFITGIENNMAKEPELLAWIVTYQDYDDSTGCHYQTVVYAINKDQAYDTFKESSCNDDIISIHKD